ncbi:MAG: hypothetical protein QOC61_1447 [Acidobacteriota bacterium]|nr:hypothetical protein [Acidobacteriota bacterium]
MRDSHKFLRYALGLALTFLALGGAHAVNAQIDPFRQLSKYEFAAIGIARGQAARLNVYYHNVFPPGPCAQDGSCRPAGTFRVTMSFYECDGSIAVQNSIDLPPDRSGLLNFSPTSFHADGRACGRADVKVSPDASGFTPILVPSVEVMDAATGQTSLLNPGAIVGFNPQPEPPGDASFGSFNVVRGQTARVSASYVDIPDGFPPGPCRVTFSFYSGDGQLIGQSIQTLEYGKTAQFDLPTNNFPAGWRARIRASVHIETADGTVVPCIMPAVEVFAGDTGKGAIFYPGKMIGE